MSGHQSLLPSAPRPSAEPSATAGAHREAATVDSTELTRVLEWITSGEFVAHMGGVKAEPQDRWPGASVGLSAREAQIITLIAQGMSNSELASPIYLGINTVKTYIRSAYRKMGVTTRSQAVLWAIDHGLRPDDGRGGSAR